MASPFPGMDPYLESPAVWPAFQHHFVAALGEVLQRSLGDDYRLRVAQRYYVNQQVLFTSVTNEEHREELLEVRQRSTGRLVTWLSVVSPTNRTSPIGRQEYLASRDEARRQGAHLVEFDLVLQGQTCLDLSSSSLPEFDYAVCVCRSRRPDRFELYTATLDKRLPRVRVPLTLDDRDTVVDVQLVLTRAYDALNPAIDYQQRPPVLLDDARSKWVRQLLAGGNPAM